MDFKRWTAVALCAALGAGAGLGVSACGDDDERGGVEVETSGTSTTGTSTTGTTTSP